MATGIFRHILTLTLRHAVVIAVAMLLVVFGPVPSPSAAEWAGEGMGRTADPETQAEIEQVFSQAQSNLAAGDGAKVLPLLSSESGKRIDAIRAAARTDDAANLGQFSPSEKVAVLYLRRFLTPSQRQDMSTSELVDDALSRHWLSLKTIADSSLGPLRVADATHANAPLLLKDRPTVVSAAFVREGADWHIDLVRTTRVADQWLRMLGSLAGRSEDAYAADLVNRLHGPTSTR